MMELLLSTAVDSENDTPGDLRLTRGSLVWSSDPILEVAQRLRSRLRMFKGEWFLDRRQGIPYFQKVFQGATDATLRAIFSRAIRGTPGVRSLDSISVVRDRALRTVDVTFKCTLASGKVFSSADHGPFLVEI